MFPAVSPAPTGRYFRSPKDKSQMRRSPGQVSPKGRVHSLVGDVDNVTSLEINFSGYSPDLNVRADRDQLALRVDACDVARNTRCAEARSSLIFSFFELSNLPAKLSVHMI